jgi:hypothetical protein
MEITAAEVKFSRIAQNRAHLDHVGDFAKMLERDHTQTSIEGLRQKPGADITAMFIDAIMTESDKQTRAKARDYERAQQSNT